MSTEDNASFVTRVAYEPEHDKPGQKRAIDEMVTGPVDWVHIERMNDGYYWLCLCRGDERQVVLFSVEARGLIVARTGAE